MSWILPELSDALRLENHREMRRRYTSQWEKDNRKRRNKYWREYYARHRIARRQYLNRKQIEYRAAAKRNPVGRGNSGSRKGVVQNAKGISLVRAIQALKNPSASQRHGQVPGNGDLPAQVELRKAA